MKNRLTVGPRALVVALACLVGTSPAMADKPSWAGGGKHGKQHADDRDDGGGRHERQGNSGSIDIRIGDPNRQIIVDYYQAQARAGHCPPGLAKKNNGCQPPGQAKKWSRGRPLPSGMEYHDLPRDLVVRLPMPPAGHRYVQVASDILLIAVGSSMVVDAVEDLLR